MRIVYIVFAYEYRFLVSPHSKRMVYIAGFFLHKCFGGYVMHSSPPKYILHAMWSFGQLMAGVRCIPASS